MRKLKTLEIVRMSAEEYRSAAKVPLVVVLDDVRSLYNVGAVFRSADAFAVERAVLGGITAVPPSAEIHKTALGAEETVAWEQWGSAADAVRSLRAAGYTVLAIEQCDGSVALEDLRLVAGGRYAVVLGNEVKGVSQATIDCCDGCVEIPQYGTKHSLNVSVAAGIVMHAFSSEWRMGKCIMLNGMEN